MPAEQLFANSTRLFQETAVRSGLPTGDVIEPGITRALAIREIALMDEKTTPFRHKLESVPIHNSYQIRTSHEVGLELLSFILSPHLRAGTKLDHQSPDPTFTLQIESENGDKVAYKGLALAELQLSFVARGVVTMEVSWVALERSEISGNLENVTREITTHLVPGTNADIVAKQGSGIDRLADASDARNAELFIKRSIRAAQFDANGDPARLERQSWQVLGEIQIPSNALTKTANEDFIDGSAGFFIGQTGADLQILFDDQVRFIATGEPIKADDFRDIEVIFEANPDASGALLTFSDNT